MQEFIGVDLSKRRSQRGWSRWRWPTSSRMLAMLPTGEAFRVATFERAC